MNHIDELRQIPPPIRCQACINYAKMTGPDGNARHECLNGHPMHPNCGWYAKKNAPTP